MNLKWGCDESIKNSGVGLRLTYNGQGAEVLRFVVSHGHGEGAIQANDFSTYLKVMLMYEEI